MRVAYFDCPSGAAGDMVMGALVDAGVPFEALRAELAKLGLRVSPTSIRRLLVRAKLEPAPRRSAIRAAARRGGGPGP